MFCCLATVCRFFSCFFFFFFNDTATTEIYTLSLHDALPISMHRRQPPEHAFIPAATHDRCGSGNGAWPAATSLKVGWQRRRQADDRCRPSRGLRSKEPNQEPT